MATALRRNHRLEFCSTCNARERIIVDGRCLICGNAPRPEVAVARAFRRPPVTESLYCPACDRTFVAASRGEVERLFDEHLTEVRDPAGHLPEPF